MQPECLQRVFDMCLPASQECEGSPHGQVVVAWQDVSTMDLSREPPMPTEFGAGCTQYFHRHQRRHLQILNTAFSCKKLHPQLGICDKCKNHYNQSFGPKIRAFLQKP